MVAAFNPCGFAMLPAYLALVVRRPGDGPLVALGRAGLATSAMALGFLEVFGSFGLLTVSVASIVQRYLPYVTLLIGCVLIALGGWLLSGRELVIGSMGKGSHWAPTARLWSMTGYGVGYALASLSCTIGPFLAVTGSSVGTGSALGAMSVYLAYAAGFVLVVGALAGALAVASSTLVDRMRAVLPYVNRAGGLIMVAVGLYVAYYGWFELRLFGSEVGVNDPVITSAGRFQRALAGFVYTNGAWPWLVALVALLATALAATWIRRRRVTRRSTRAAGR